MPFLLFGVLLGLTLYTYPSALMLPAIFLAWALLHPRRLRGRWRGFVLAYLIAGVMAIPLARAWLDPTSTARAAAIDAPLEALRAGDFGPVLDNVLPILGNFTVAGDHGLEFNLQDQPIFPSPLMAAFFYAGLAITLWRAVRRRDPRYTLLVVWLVGMLVPTLVTARPVNPSRTIGLMSVVFIVPAVVVAEAGAMRRNPHPASPLQGGDRRSEGVSPEPEKHSSPRTRWLTGGLAAMMAAALAWQAVETARGYFVEWAGNPVVRFLYQEDYRLLAAAWDAAPPGLPTALGGLTPDRMDMVTMRLLLDDDSLAESLGYFDPQTALLLPGDGESLIVIPNLVTLHPALAAWLEPYTVGVEEGETYRAYRVVPPTLPEVAVFVQPDGGAEAAYLGFAGPDEAGTVITFWRAVHPSPVELRIFVHLTDEAGNILAQSDMLGVPATAWRTGDCIIQAHALPLPGNAPAGPYGLTIGLYDPASGARLRVGEGDFLHIQVGD